MKRQTTIRLAAIALVASMTVGTLEVGSYILWHQRIDTARNTALYSERKHTVEQVRLNPAIPVLGFAPGTIAVSFSSEFVDRFKTSEIPALGVALFDDGIDEDRPIKSLVIGDFLGRGVGAERLENNWVETAERNLPDVDLLNLSYVGGNVNDYIKTYERLGGRLQHRLVILSLDSDSDFIDTARYSDWVAQFSGDEAAIQRLLTAFNFDPGCEANLALPFRSYTASIVVELLRQKYAWAAKNLRNFLPTCPSDGGTTPEWIPAERQAATARSDAARRQAVSQDADMTPIVRSIALGETPTGNISVSGDGMTFRFFSHHLDVAAQADALGRYVATKINRLAENLREKGNVLVLVVHPSKAMIYPERISPPPKMDSLRRANRALQAALDPAVPVIDLFEPLKRAKNETSDLLFWRVDLHYSPAGYRAAGEAVAEGLRQILKRPDIALMVAE